MKVITFSFVLFAGADNIYTIKIWIKNIIFIQLGINYLKWYLIIDHTDLLSHKVFVYLIS